MVHHNQSKLCTIPPANEKDSQGNQDPALAKSNAVVDESRGDSKEVTVGDETENLDTDTTQTQRVNRWKIQWGSRRWRIMLVQKKRKTGERQRKT